MGYQLMALCRTVALCMMLVGWLPQVGAAQPNEDRRETHIRAGFGRTIVAVKGQPMPLDARAARASTDELPRPRLAGFSPLVAIATSDEGNSFGQGDFAHELESSYVGSLLNPLADPDFVIGFLDSGADVDLAAGTARDTLGLFDDNLTDYTIEIGGVGEETVFADMTIPVGFFAAGLSAVYPNGTLDYDALVGHSTVCGLAAPAIECGSGEVVTAIIGRPFLSFYNSIIWVDTPLTVSVGGVTYTGPEVQIQDTSDTLPTFPRKIAMEFSPGTATTASYLWFEMWPELTTPTVLAMAPGVPTGGAFFATIYVVEGEPGPTNPVIPMRVLVDTGAQSSIMSSSMVANLSLPMDPDFTVDVCGVGGLVEDVPAYYVDYVNINAQGGELQFSQAPFVVLDLPSPEGGTLDGVLGMNFFWNRNVIFEPHPAQGSGFLHVSATIPVPYGDSDVDFDVDGDDTQMFVSCITGPDADTFIPGCEHLDGDSDGDVDLTDFARFQLCFSGADVTADPDCGF